jgi:hypothetical protein
MNGMQEKKKNTTNEFAQAAIIVAIASFIQLLGIEKALIAIIFAVLALRSLPESRQKGKALAIVALVLSIAYIIFISGFLYAHLPEIKNLFYSLQKVSL